MTNPNNKIITTSNLVDGQTMTPHVTTITFPKPYECVVNVKFAMKALTSKYSAAYYYFYDSKSNKVGEAHTVPGNYATTKGEFWFDNPIEVASVQLYSWWNPAEAIELEFTYCPVLRSSNLVCGQTLSPALTDTPIKPSYDYVVGGNFTTKALTSNYSTTFAYLFSNNKQSGVINVVPGNNQSKTGSTSFTPAIAVDSAHLYSWWNNAEAEALTLDYVETSQTNNLVSGQVIGTSPTHIIFPQRYRYITSVSYTVKANTAAISNANFYLLNKKGQTVGTVNATPSNLTDLSGTIHFEHPIKELSSMTLYSWWNSATAVEFKLNYLL